MSISIAEAEAREPEHDREDRLALAAAAGDRRAVDALVRKFGRLLELKAADACRKRGRLDMLDDMRQVALASVVDAVRGFDPRKGHFLRRAVATAERAIAHELYANQVESEDVVNRRVWLANKIVQLTRELGRSPTKDEVAAASGRATSEEAIERATFGAARPISIEASQEEAYVARVASGRAIRATEAKIDEATLDEDSIADAIDEKDLHVRLLIAAVSLPDLPRAVVEWRFGLTGDEPASMKAIATRIGRSEQQTKAILTEAIATLRGQMLGDA